MPFMVSLFDLFSRAVIVLLVLYSIKRLILERWFWSTGKDRKKRYHPIAGTAFNLLLNFDRLHDYMTELATKYKSYRFLSPFRIQAFTADPANIEYILKTNFANYGKGWYNYNILTDLLGDGIFAVDGDQWRHQRKVASYEFSTKVLRDFSSVVFIEKASKLAQEIYGEATSNQVFDIQDLLLKSTMDSIFKVGFGLELDNLNGMTEEGISFTKAFDECLALTVWRYVDVTWKIKKFFNIGSEAKYKKYIQVIDYFVYKIIHSKIKQVSTSHDNYSNKREDILSRFIELGSDPKFLRDIILSFITAGRDSTASGLSWFLYMLCRHPLVQERVAQEVREATNTNLNTPFDEFVASVNQKALDDMQYLHAALSETLRLYPPGPVDGKMCFSEDTLPDGFTLRAGDAISYLPYAMGRMKFIWGEDAEVFLPERWLDENGLFRNENSFKFPVFQAGPRICLGKDFAYRQMKIFSAILLGCFRFKLSDEKDVVNYKTTTTLQIDGGLHLRAFDRRGPPTNSIEIWSGP